METTKGRQIQYFFYDFTPREVEELAKRLQRMWGAKFYYPDLRYKGGPTTRRLLKVAKEHHGLLTGEVLVPKGKFKGHHVLVISSVAFPEKTSGKVIQELEKAVSPGVEINAWKAGNRIHVGWD